MTALHCSEPGLPSDEVIARYQADAKILCEAMVDCLRNDVEEKMAENPERRDMMLSRMDRELCLENQFRLIGQFSGSFQGQAAAEEELYRMYTNCSAAVASAENCEQRLETRRSNPACKVFYDSNSGEP